MPAAWANWTAANTSPPMAIGIVAVSAGINGCECRWVRRSQVGAANLHFPGGWQASRL